MISIINCILKFQQIGESEEYSLWQTYIYYSVKGASIPEFVRRIFSEKIDEILFTLRIEYLWVILSI